VRRRCEPAATIASIASIASIATIATIATIAALGRQSLPCDRCASRHGACQRGPPDFV